MSKSPTPNSKSSTSRKQPLTNQSPTRRKRSLKVFQTPKQSKNIRTTKPSNRSFTCRTLACTSSTTRAKTQIIIASRNRKTPRPASLCSTWTPLNLSFQNCTPPKSATRLSTKTSSGTYASSSATTSTQCQISKAVKRPKRALSSTSSTATSTSALQNRCLRRWTNMTLCSHWAVWSTPKRCWKCLIAKAKRAGSSRSTTTSTNSVSRDWTCCCKRNQWFSWFCSTWGKIPLSASKSLPTWHGSKLPTSRPSTLCWSTTLSKLWTRSSTSKKFWLLTVGRKTT